MLIIFDLDDTLIDTSGCLTFHKLEEALCAMENAGLLVEDFPQSLELLRRLDRTAESAKEALSEFLEIQGAERKWMEIGLQEIYDKPSLSLPIYPLDGVVEVLSDLSQHHRLALVSNGKIDLQMEKLKKAGIDSQIFSKISISDERCKKQRYQIIADDLGYCPSEVIVCGDRILIDLAPARELGFRTVHMQWGRGGRYAGARCEVDHRITDFKELKNIVSRLI